MIKKYVVSLKLARKIDKLGWYKKTIFYYVKLKSCKHPRLCYHYDEYFFDLLDYCKVISIQNIENWWFAPLFAEIWEELPYYIQIKGEEWKDYDLMIIKNTRNETIIVYKTTSGFHERLRKSEKPIYNINPAEAAGEMWCWLVKNGYLEEK